MEKITGAIIGELVLGEILEWNVGICTVKYNHRTDDIVVVSDDSGQTIRIVDISRYRNQGDDNSIPLERVANIVNTAASNELNKL